MIVGLLGGRAAEEIHFGHITTGASNDLERSTSIARAMVTRYGMSEKLGLRVYGEEDRELFFGRSMGSEHNYSEESARAIDAEVNTIISKAYARAQKMLRKNQDKLAALAATLLEHETVDRTMFESLMVG
jgi:cell division protease FtsH